MDMKNVLRKLITAEECSLKSKHVDKLLSEIYKPGNPQYFLKALNVEENSFKLKTNYICAWKICQLIHRILITDINNIFNNEIKNFEWLSLIGSEILLSNYLIDNYDKCIKSYIELIKFKIKFHVKHRNIPANFSINKDNLEKIYNSNNILEIASDMFDYLESIINLQGNVFDTNLTYGIKSIVECRFMPLSNLINESKFIYFHGVELMYHLHSNFKYIDLNDKRLRFENIFFCLKLFYERTTKLNILENYIWIPQMSNEPPKFTAKFDEKLKQSNGNKKPPLLLKPVVNSQHRNEDHFYDSDFDTSSDEDIVQTPIKNSHKSEVKELHPSSNSFNEEDKIMKELKNKINLLELTISEKNLEITNLKQEIFKLKQNERSKDLPQNHLAKQGIVLKPNEYEKYSSTDNLNRSSDRIAQGFKAASNVVKPLLNSKPQIQPKSSSLYSKSMWNLNGNFMQSNAEKQNDRLPNSSKNNFPTLNLRRNRMSAALPSNFSTLSRNQNYHGSNNELNRRSLNFSEAKSFWTNQTVPSFNRK